jgi:hypothetical protein
MPDSTLRVVFTNEAGVKFFDYEFSKTGSFRIVESIKPLKRKVVSNVLRKDLALATLLKVRTGVVPGVSANAQSKIYTLGIKDDVNRFTIDNNCSQLTRAERYDDDAVKARVTFYGSPAVPDSIFVSHVDFDMDIRLRLLKKE